MQRKAGFHLTFGPPQPPRGSLSPGAAAFLQASLGLSHANRHLPSLPEVRASLTCAVSSPWDALSKVGMKIPTGPVLTVETGTTHVTLLLPAAPAGTEPGTFPGWALLGYSLWGLLIGVWLPYWPPESSVYFLVHPFAHVTQTS